MIVIDASLALAVMVRADEAGALCARLETAGALAAPEVFDLEVLQVMKRFARREAGAERVAGALRTLEDLRVERFSHALLRDRIWSLRDNLTAYDAAYFALAELLNVPLWTRDCKYVDVPGAAAAVTVL